MQAVILAAGESSRFWPLSENRHKSLVKIMGKPIIQWTIESLHKSGVDDVIVVQSPKKDIETAIGGKVGKTNVRYVVQKEALGMGNAVSQAEEYLSGRFFVMNPNHFFAEEVIENMVGKLEKSGADMLLLGKETDRPWDYGMLGLKGDKAVDIVEKPERGKEPSKTRVVGLYLLGEEFFDFYKKTREHQYSFEDALKLCMDNLDVRVEITDKEEPSIKYPWHLFQLAKVLMDSKIKRQYVSDSAKIGKNAVIDGNVHIGDNTVVHENAVIKGPCYIGNDCVVGNMSLLRNYSNLEDNVKVGAYAEVKNCIMQENVSAHSGFLGDSIFDTGCKIGAGTTTANRRLDRSDIMCMVKGKEVGTGLSFFGSVVGENTKFGIMAMLMPGTLVGANCIIGAGSMVKKNMDSDTVLYTKYEEIVEKRHEKS